MIPPDDSDDDERTIVRPTSTRGAGAMSPSSAIPFPSAGEAESPIESTRGAPAPLGHTLPVGTRLRDYEITGLIGEGGFGIVYSAWDHSLQRKVAVKEYMPAAMASRIAGSSAIVVKSDRHLDTFKAGLKSFVNEARLLARFDHPSLVKVYRFWEENGTAYMVMPFYEGPTLKTALAELGHVPDEDELRAWLNPLLDALTVMHAANCFHRDIAPDNILLTASGPLLLDFGAARRVIGDMTHALTVVLKPGYAPIEQYGDVASMSQGAWTDLYALACVVYYAITGKTPMSSVERLMDDRIEPLSALAAGRYSAGFLRAMDAALAVRPQDRPQNEAQFRALLDADRPTVAAPVPPAAPAVHHEAFASTQRHVYSTVPGTLTPVLATQLLVRPPADSVMPPDTLTSDFATHALASAPSTLAPDSILPAIGAPQAVSARLGDAATGRGKGVLVVVALFIVVLGVAAAALWLLPATRWGAPAAAPADVASSVAAPVREPAPASAAARVPATATAASAAIVAPATPGLVESPAMTQTPLRETAPVEVAPPTPALATPASSPSPSPSSEVEVVMPAPRHPAAVASAPSPRVRRDSTPRRVETPAEARPETPRRTTSGSRCSDILQKASLEPLTAEEAAYLKRECR